MCFWKLYDSDIDPTEPPSPSSTDVSIPDSTELPSPSSGRRQSWDWSDDEFWGDDENYLDHNSVQVSEDDDENYLGSAWQNYLGDISVHVMEEEEGEVCLGPSIWQVWVRRARKHGKVRRGGGRTTGRKRRRRQERRRRQALRRKKLARPGRVIKRRCPRGCFRGGADVQVCFASSII